MTWLMIAVVLAGLLVLLGRSGPSGERVLRGLRTRGLSLPLTLGIGVLGLVMLARGSLAGFAPLLLSLAMTAALRLGSGTPPAPAPPAAQPPTPAPSMTAAEARKILGLPDSPSADAVIAAHRRLIQQVHPDQGGSDYLAAQINRARDVLLPRSTNP